jgi:plasmid stabilization system protein ParE
MKVVWLTAAESQLEDIYEFEARRSPVYAAKVYNDIIDAADKYLALPVSTARELSLNDLPREYRRIIVMRKYKIIYRPDPVTGRMVVVSVWDCRRDPAFLRASVMRADTSAIPK